MRHVGAWALGFWIALSACGDANLSLNTNVPTGAPPVVIDVIPSSAARGTEVSVRGVGYSIVPIENFIHFGESAIPADRYEILDQAQNGAIEQLTFTVPGDAATGDFNLFVSVLGEVSNADTIFTVAP